MFLKSIDSKQEYTTPDGSTYLDLTEGIFDTKQSMSQMYSVYKVPEQYRMRPDLISYALYGTDAYVEMILKYSVLPNPFAVDKDDIVYSVSLNGMYNPVKELETEKVNTNFNLLKNYHKYIDKSKVPTSPGSQENTIGTGKIVTNGEVINGTTDNTVTSVNGAYSIGAEANISTTGLTGITVENGRIYFGTTTATQTGSAARTANGVSDIDPENAYKISAGITLENGKVYFNTDNYTTLTTPEGSKAPTVTAISNDGTEITTVDDTTNGTTYTTINTKTGQRITTKKNSDGTTTTEIKDPITGTTRSVTVKPTVTSSNSNINTNMVLTTDSEGNTVLSNPEYVVSPVIGNTATTTSAPGIAVDSNSDLNAVDDSLTDTPQASCAESGISLGEFLRATISNSIGK